MNTTRIIKKISYTNYKQLVTQYKQKISVSHHALDHLSDAQREINNEEELISVLTEEKPVGAGIQRNGNYAAFFRRKWGFLRLIFSVSDSRLEIITFINLETMPNLAGLKNGK